MMPDACRWRANIEWNFIYVEYRSEQIRVMAARPFHGSEILNP